MNTSTKKTKASGRAYPAGKKTKKTQKKKKIKIKTQKNNETKRDNKKYNRAANSRTKTFS